MKPLIAIAFYSTFITINCENFDENSCENLTNSVITPDPISEEKCLKATIFGQNQCAFDACLKWNCLELTDKSFCYALWEGMCCVGRLVTNRCTQEDYRILQQEYRVIQCKYESTNCSDYPRSELYCQNSSSHLYLNLLNTFVMTALVFACFLNQNFFLVFYKNQTYLIHKKHVFLI